MVDRKMGEINFNAENFWKEHVEISNKINAKVMNGTATDLEKLIIGYGAMIKLNHKEVSDHLVNLCNLAEKDAIEQKSGLEKQNLLLNELKEFSEIDLRELERKIECIEDQIDAITNKYDIYGGSNE